MKKYLIQKIVFVVAILCYLAAVACVFAAVLYESAQTNDPVRGSLMAAVVFFLGCGVVLHVMATARLKGVLSGSGDIEDDRT